MRLLGKLAAIACFAVLVGRAGADDDKSTKFDDSTFVDKASTAGRMEVAAGKVAMTRARHDDVKKFAARMVEDHTKANSELLTIVSDARIAIPEKLTPEQEKMLMHLSADTTKDFDKEYMKHMVEDHEKAVELFTKASKEVKNEKLKAFAEKTLPTIKEHLEMSKKINDNLK